MAGEVLVINPRRHRRGRRRKARVGTHRRRRRARARARRNPFFYNPHRRSRRRRASRGRRHHRRRRVHRNPSLFGGRRIFGISVGQAITGAGGFIGTNLLANQLTKFIPAEWQSGQTGPLVRVGVKVAAVAGGAMVLRMLRQPGLANAWTVGGGIAVVVDLAQTYLLPAIGLSDYETGQLTDYESGMLTGGVEAEDVQMDSVYSGGIYG